MRIVFFGSDDFAAICLNELISNAQKAPLSYTVVACVTQSDKRQGRGMKLTLSPIKEIAMEHDIVCLQPESLKEDRVIDQLRSFQADLFVVVAYGKLLPQQVLDIPKMFCINVHGSLLPKYRGAAPVNWAILNGDPHTGVTIQKMVLALDAGDIIAQEEMIIEQQETSAQLRQRMAYSGAKLLARTMDHIKAGEYTLSAQDMAEATYAPKLSKDMGKIDWNKPTQHIFNQIRGLQPWPGAFTTYKNKILKIVEAFPVAVHQSSLNAGSIVEIRKEGFVVSCADKGLLVKKVHLEASKVNSAYDFVQGYHLKLGDFCGS